MAGSPSVVTLHVWGVPTSAVAASVTHVAADRRRVRRYPGVTFAKLLGTGSGATFGVRDADPHHWGMLTVWDSRQSAAAFERSRIVRGWDARSDERLRMLLEPVAARGCWSGVEPFGRPDPRLISGPVAAVTRARLRPSLATTFWRSVPPVAAELRGSAGLLMSVGIGEMPVGLQGTVSVWTDEDSLADFAYRAPEHAAAIRRTQELGWYAEELFARFAVLECDGRLGGRDVMPAGDGP